MREAKNVVSIEGILSEVDLRDGSYMRDGKSVEYINGSYTVKVHGIEYHNEPKDMDIKVRIFVNKYTKAGAVNPAWENAKMIRDDMVSIAAAGGEEGADGIVIYAPRGNNRSNGKIQQVEYYKDDRLVSFPGITASFARKTPKDRIHPKAEFEAEFYINGITPEVNLDGEETGRYKIAAIIPGYNNAVEMTELICEGEDVVNYITNYWQKGDTVSAWGILNFGAETVETERKAAFGTAPKTYGTKTVTELVIMGSNDGAPFEGEFAYTRREIDEAVANHKARLEQKKNAAPKVEGTKKTLKDLGF